MTGRQDAKVGPRVEGYSPGQGQRDKLTRPTDLSPLEDSVWDQFYVQFGWYNRSAQRNRLAYEILKVSALVVVAAVTVLAAAGAPAALTATLAASVVAIEGVQQVFQFHANWLSHRTAAETLRQHALLFSAGAPPYSDTTTRKTRLAELVYEVTSKETGSWAKIMRVSPDHAGGPSRE